MWRGLAVLAITAALFAGCALFGVAPEPDDAPRAGGATRIDRVTIADDRRSVRVDFVGGAEFDPDNVCTTAYEATAEIVDGQLEIGVFALVHPKEPQEGDFCDLIGFPRELTIELPEPYRGAFVRDVTGPVLELEAH
jgi:hypothetical protein